jgi:CRP-like cAMP-binding protein
MTINPAYNLGENTNIFSQLAETLRLIGKSIRIEKGQCILTEGEIVDCVFLVEKGCFRTYRWVENEEVTIGFSFEGDLDTCPFAFINHTKSTDIIESLTDSRVIKIYRFDIEHLQKTKPEMNTFIQFLLSHYIEVLIQRNIDLRTKSADIRYAELLTRQPQEVSKIQLMYIASYLGITKERLSRIRKKINPVD